MSAADARWHRTQRTADACHATACTIAASLSAIAAYTRGAHGPSTSLDTFRSWQLDTVGGQDLYDCKHAARRLAVGFTVHAAYGPGPEYSVAVAAGLRDEPSISPAAGSALLAAGRFGVLQLLYGALPPDLRHDAAFRGPHSVALLGVRPDELLVADPLASSAHWHPAAPFWHAATELCSPNRVNLSVTPVRPSAWVARVRRAAWWHRYTRVPGGWRRERRFTATGWHAECEAPAPERVDGATITLARITEGGYAGSYVAPAGYAVTVTEVS